MGRILHCNNVWSALPLYILVIEISKNIHMKNEYDYPSLDVLFGDYAWRSEEALNEMDLHQLSEVCTTEELIRETLINWKLKMP